MPKYHIENNGLFRFHREDYPFHWIVNVHSKYNQLMEIELKKIELDVSRFRILRLAHDMNVASITQISEYAIIKMPTVVKIVARLKDEGLIATAASKEDGRVTLVSLTDRGQELVDTAMRRVKKIFEKAFDGISPQQAEKMNLILAMILENMNDKSSAL